MLIERKKMGVMMVKMKMKGKAAEEEELKEVV